MRVKSRSLLVDGIGKKLIIIFMMIFIFLIRKVFFYYNTLYSLI